MNQFTSILHTRTQLTGDTALYTFFVPNQTIDYKPGQFISLLIPQPNEAKPLIRAYSIAGTPAGLFGPDTVTTNTYNLFIRHLDGGKGTSILKNLPLGTAIKTVGPSGALLVDRHVDTSTTLVFCASATGIAPFLAILQHLAYCGVFFNIRVFWGLRGAQDMCFVEDFLLYESLWRAHGVDLSITYFLSRQQMMPGQGNIHIALGRIQSGFPSLPHDLNHKCVFYLCGGKEFVADVKDTLQTLFPQSSIVTERFN